MPPVKELARRVTLAVARETAEPVLRLKTAAEVREYLTRKTREVRPDGSLAET